jgi:hypothetical protein
VAERKHRHIVESALSMLHDTQIPLSLWTEAFHTAVYVINRLPMRLLNNLTPYFVLFGTQPQYSQLRVFGCVCYVHIDSSQRNKFQDKACRCKFVGYADEYKGYRCYDPDTQRIKVSRNVVFDENNVQDSNKEGKATKEEESYQPWLANELFDQLEMDNSAPCHTVINECEPMESNAESTGNMLTAAQESVMSPTADDRRFKGVVYARRGDTPPTTEEVRRSERIRHPIDRWVSYENFSTEMQLYVAQVEKQEEPIDFSQASLSPKWANAMNEEMGALHECRT